MTVGQRQAGIDQQAMAVLRRMAARQGLQLTRSRRRDRRAIDFGGFMLIDIYRDIGIMGDQPYAFSATLDDVEAYLKGEDEQAA